MTIVVLFRSMPVAIGGVYRCCVPSPICVRDRRAGSKEAACYLGRGKEEKECSALAGADDLVGLLPVSVLPGQEKPGRRPAVARSRILGSLGSPCQFSWLFIEMQSGGQGGSARRWQEQKETAW